MIAGRVLAAGLAVLLLALVGCSAPPGPDLDGRWNGTIATPGAPLPLGVTFDGDGGTLDIPAQGITDLPLGEVVRDGGTVTFDVPGLPGAASFAGTVDGDTLRGEFTQVGTSLPFTLQRGAPESPGRPQEPREPFAYRSEEVSYPSGEVTLAGTLTLPEGQGPFPAVLLITGSGAQDRDATIAGHRPFLLRADTLTRAGFGVLRVDDRGTGGSGGDLARAGYDTLTADVVAGLDYLGTRAELDPARTGLFGHSEGGYLAPLAAQQREVAFVIGMAGPAVPGQQVLELQNRLLYETAGLPAAQVEQQVAFIRELGALMAAGDVDGARELSRARLEESAAVLPEDRRPDPADLEAANPVTPNFAAFATHDPAPALRTLDVPVLAFYGGKDLQVPAAQSGPALRELLAGRPDVTIETFPELNHLMQPATTGSVEEYPAIETTIDPVVLDLVTGWLQERFS
jgi:uncharacterized protein